MYHIITPLARYENLNKLITMLEPKNIQWHIITDDDSKFKLQFDQDWIHYYICPNKEKQFFERCNYSINWFLDNNELEPDDMYCILNDDDSYEEDFFSKIESTLLNIENSDIKNVVICSMERGHNIPDSAIGIRRHGTEKLWAHPDFMKLSSVGVEQIILKGKILTNYRIPLEPAGDGMFIVNVLQNNNAILMPDINILFNYFEPGRWNK